MAGADSLRVEVAYCAGPGEDDRVWLDLAAGATLADALRASGVLERHGLQPDAVRVGIWCKPREPGAALRDRDRVEVYRPLAVDPKEARRQRYKKHKSG